MFSFVDKSFFKSFVAYPTAFSPILNRLNGVIGHVYHTVLFTVLVFSSGYYCQTSLGLSHFSHNCFFISKRARKPEVQAVNKVWKSWFIEQIARPEKWEGVVLFMKCMCKKTFAQRVSFWSCFLKYLCCHKNYSILKLQFSICCDSFLKVYGN